MFDPDSFINDRIDFRLKNVIDRMMPSVLENFSKECLRVAEEK
jgi:hypothetical protein